MDGLLIVNKEKGFTSFDVVAKLRGILGEKKIGHLGTLDPEAEGVLPVLLGRATRLAPVLEGSEKVYRATLLLGITTDTQDTAGRLLSRRRVEASEDKIRQTILARRGEQDQIPPMFSAKKVAGSKLLELAREGRELERKPCRIQILQLEILHMALPRIELRIRCSAGTYIRTLCHDIGEELGCGGAMESLVREEAAGHCLEEAVKLDEITTLSLTGGLNQKLIPLNALLEAFPGFICAPRLDKPAENGNILDTRKGVFKAPAGDGALVHVMRSDLRSLGLFRYEQASGKLRPAVMLGREPEEKEARPRPCVLSLGKFDGVHVGHQAILREMLSQAEDEKLSTVVICFTNPPEAEPGPGKDACLTTAEEKRLLLKEMGIRKVVEARFTRDMRDMEAETFLREVLIKRFGMKKIVAGPDCSFGKDRVGNIDFLKARANELGYTVTVVDKIRLGDEIVSSSRIKRLIRDGEMEEAARCLGRPYTVKGRVGYGRHLGESLGFPTINLTMPGEKVSPPRGVYASLVQLGDAKIPGMSNFGTKPTVEEGTSPAWETHLLREEGLYYGCPCLLGLLWFLRPEIRFENIQRLREQLERDRESILSDQGKQHLSQVYALWD